MNIEKVIDREFLKAKKRDWNAIYIVVDIHDTVFKSTYASSNEKEFYPNAKEALKYLSERKDIILICWSSISEEIYKREYLPIFESEKIKFQFLNENPLEKNTSYADFSKKFYFNLLLDDKAGFDPFTDWQLVHNTIFFWEELNNA